MSYFYRNTLDAKVRRKFSSLLHSFFVDVNPDHRSSILVFGSGRSGTNWLAETINFDQTYRFIVEPFNRERVPIAAGFSKAQYLRPGDDDARFVEPAQTIFQGRVRCPWTDSMNARSIAHSRVIKDVRSTLLSGWIAGHFPGMPLVFIVRHPCAVAHSRSRLNWVPRSPDVYLSQPALMEDHLEPFRDLIEGQQSDFLRHVLDWCIENYVPKRQLDLARPCVVQYERLVADRERELRRVFRYVGRPFDVGAVRRSERPSATAFAQPASRVPAMWDSSERWDRRRPRSEIRGAMSIVERFGLESWYSSEAAPLTDESLARPAR